MVKWLNHVTIAAPRNGTNSHTVDPNAGTVVAGAAFVPTAGRLLVVIAEGAVTSTTPSGWTLPTGGSAINNTGLYLWYRTAAGSDTFSTTHNGSNYPVVFDIYEFPSGSTFIGSAAQGNVSAAGGAGPSLSGLTASANWRAAAVAQNRTNATSPITMSWSVGTEAVDTLAVQGGTPTTDGYCYSLAYVEDSAAATFSSAATSTDTSTSCERLVFAFNIAAAGTSLTADPATLTLQGQTPSLDGSGSASIPVDTASLNLQGQTPAIAGSGSADIVADKATLTLQGQTPILAGSGNVDISVDTAILNLQGQTPTLGSGIVIPVDTAVLSLQGQTPTLTAGPGPTPYVFGVEFEISYEGSSL